jgi:hypothetical protein
MINKTIFVLAALFAGLTITSSAHAERPALLQTALNPPEPMPTYRHTVFIKEDDFEGTARIDPTQPAGQRVALINATLAADDPELAVLLAEADADPMDGFWCHEMAELVPEQVTEVRRSEQTITYGFAPTPGPDSDEDDVKFMKNLTGEIRIDEATQTIASVRLFAKRPFRVSMAVKIKAFDMQATCDALPTGGSRLVESTTRIQARALFRRLEQLEIKRVSDVELASFEGE